jgi:hypothetical protein
VIALFGLPSALPASAAPAAADSVKAANYLVKNLPSAKADAGLAASAALGLATTGDCTYAPSVRTLVSGLESQARKFTSGQPGRAAKLAITVSALGLNPKSFGGVNLASAITKKLPADGQIGSSESAFTQSLAIIALKRAGATIPVTLLTKLLSLQDSTGAFGYEFPAGTFNPDPDTTALAILALHTLGHLDPQVDKAIDAAEDSQTSEGYWDTFSPVDSTSLVGSSLKASGENVDDAANWLAGQQLSNGGFPASLNGTDADVFATSEAMFLATGKTMADATLKLSTCPKSPKKLPASVTSCAGVWVVVDRGNGQDTVRCATKYGNGIAALKSAGLAAGFDKSGLLNRINGFPSVIVPWPQETRYWSYWHATQQADGTWDSWQSYPVGAADSTPVTGEAEGWYYANYDAGPSRAFPAPPKGYSTSEVPTIDNTAPKVGDTLTVTPGTWTPAPDLAIRWYRNGSSIKGATKSTFVVTSKDYKKVITVKVTATKDGFQTLSKTSLPTAKVTK